MSMSFNWLEERLGRAARAFRGGNIHNALSQLSTCYKVNPKGTEASDIYKEVIGHYDGLRGEVPSAIGFESISEFRAFSSDEAGAFADFSGDATIVFDDKDQFGRRRDIVVAKVADGAMLDDGTVLSSKGFIVHESMPRALQSPIVDGQMMLIANGIKSKIQARAPAGVVFRGSLAANYFHFLTETVAAKQFIDDNIPFASPFPVYRRSDAREPRYVGSYLSLVGGAETRESTDGLYRYQHIYVCNLSWKQIGHYPSRYNEAYDRLYEKGVASVPATFVPPRRIYLSRVGYSRGIVDEAEVFDEFLKSAGFSVVDPAKLTVGEQMKSFREAEVIIGPHGAAFTNLVYCGPNAKALEIIPPNRSCPSSFTQIARGRGIDSYLAYPRLARHGGAEQFKFADRNDFVQWADKFIRGAVEKGVTLLDRS